MELDSALIDHPTSFVLSSWQPQPAAAALVGKLLASFCQRSPDAAHLAEVLSHKTGTRLFDWVDHLAIPAGRRWEPRLEQAGFVAGEDCGDLVWRQPGGLLPPVIVHPHPQWRLAAKVESVVAFLAAAGLDDEVRIEGDPCEQLRKARLSSTSDRQLWVVERHGYRGWQRQEAAAGKIRCVLEYQEAFARRKRFFADEEDGFAHAQRWIREAVANLGAAWAADLFFAAEREYWTRRNRAAQVQKSRQDALGLGWGNHDHHTYRCSRRYFARLIALLEELGLVCRERFYAGREARWGAQVLEQPESGVVVFADVDLSAEEVGGDFAHEGLPPREHFGTVGLWCLLHGEAFLQPGLHHLECRFDFDAAREQFQRAGVRVMKPFTDLPYLKQAFTEGEIWPVDPRRLELALAAHAISAADAEQFHRNGALGSHLEILQRDEGYKGFNPSGINDIIRDTDPRRATAGA